MTRLHPGCDRADVAARYEETLRVYLRGDGEAALSRVYELARDAALCGLGVVDLSLIHHRAVCACGTAPGDERPAQFLAEALSPFEMTLRGYRDAAERAEAASQAKSRFLSNMSHELRTPLNAILGFSELLDAEIAGPLEPRQREFVRNVYDSGTHLLSLINDVLDLSKVEAGRMELVLEPTSLADVAGVVRTHLQPLADKRGVTLEVAVAEPFPWLQADRTRLRQILINLVSNGLKFTPAGGTVRIAARVAGPWAEIAVVDSGCGIAPADLPRLFHEFEQLDQAAATRSAGTGLGLALTRRLIELHGGTIRVDSKLGTGATFTCHVPLARLAAGPPITVEISADHPTITSSLVLVVDDDPLGLRLAAGCLEHAGHSVLQAGTVEEAVQLLKTRHPHVVVTDVRMPDGGGAAVLAAVRAEPARAATPVVALSAHAMDGARAELLALGFDDYLSKPIERERLVAAVQQLLAVNGRRVH